MADYFIGIDYGTRKVAVAVLTNEMEVVAVEDLVLAPADRASELYVLSGFVQHIVTPYKDSAVACIESAILGASLNAQTLANLGYTAGAASLALSMLGIKNSYVASASWKKVVLGNGAAKKEAVQAWVHDEWPWLDIKTQDQADALALAACAHIHHHQKES